MDITFCKKLFFVHLFVTFAFYNRPMNLFKKVVDVLIKLMIPFVILALMLGMAKICLDLREIFKES